MPRYPQPQIEERYEKLPEVLKEAMFSPENADLMFEVGKKFGLAIDKIGYMAEETGYVILGFTKPEEFITELEENLDIDSEKAEEVAAEINHRVFLPLREALKQTYQMEIAGESRIKNQELKERQQKSTINMAPLLPTTPAQLKTPAEPTKPMPIDLRELRKPTPPAALPETIGSEKLPELKLPKLPKPTPTKPPEMLIPITPKSAVLPKPEIMSNGGVFAAPLQKSRIMNYELGDTQMLSKKSSENPKKENTEQQTEIKPKNHDPYRESIE